MPSLFSSFSSEDVDLVADLDGLDVVEFVARR